MITQDRSTIGIEEIIIEMAKQEGKAEGRIEENKERNRFFVENLLRSINFEDNKIASLAGVPVDFVKAVKKSFDL